MKKQNAILKVAIVFIALLCAQLTYAQPCANPVNLISNGNFASGFSGFTSSLPASTGNCQRDRYAVGTSFNTACNLFPAAPNGTTMFVVDFHNSAANTMFLQQAISGVSAGTTYTVGFRGASRNGNFNVPIDVYYNGTLIGSITINTPQSFGNYSFNWTAPSGVAASGNVTFRIATQDIWNDFALTDIQFSYCPSTSWRNIYQNDKDHNHFSVVELENEDFIVAGTLYDQGKLTNTTLGVRRFDNTGNLIWQQEYFLNKAYDARCFDVTLSGTADEPIVALTGYVQVDQSAPRKTYVMILDGNNGSLIDYQEFTMSNYDQSTGLDILYVEDQESYYVAGYQADDILDVSGNKIGYIMSLDPALNINWINLITSPTQSVDRNMANNLTDLNGKGLFVTGSVNNNSSSGNISTLKVLLDYSGSVIWDLTSVSTNSHECGVDAVYDADKDELYVLSNNSVVHTFELQRIDNASSAGAFIAMAGSNNLLSILNSNVEGFSLAFDPNTEDLIVAGMIRSMPGATVNTPTFISNVDVNDFSVKSLTYIESNNAGYRDHDHDMFQAFYGQQAIINYPDILGVFPSNFVVLGYEGIGGYSLSVTRTDATGHTPSSKDCEVTVEAEPVNIEPERTEAVVEEQSAEAQRLDAYYEELTYKKYVDCEPLELRAEGKLTGIAQAVPSEGFIIYPNPASSNLQIGMPESGKTMHVTVQLTDPMGRVVIEQNDVYVSGEVAQINVAALPEGVYFLSVQADSYKAQKTIVIAH